MLTRQSRLLHNTALPSVVASLLFALSDGTSVTPNPDTAFLEAALAKGYLSRAQLQLCRHLTDNAAASKQAEVVAVEQGCLTQEQVEEVRAELQEKRPCIAGFEMLAKIGEGGMGQVYKTRQVNLDRIVALKILPPQFSEDAVFIERFYREARAAAKLQHPNIVSGLDVGFADGQHYFAMEFVDGLSLNHVLRARGKMPERECIVIVRQVAMALNHAHRSGVVHRDVKPGNIMVMSGGTAKLCDLGLARREDVDESELYEAGKALGSPRYMSPEQAKSGGAVDGRSDIYSLGVTFFHMLTGQAPFDAETSRDLMRKHVFEEPPLLLDVEPCLTPDIGDIVSKMLEKAPDDRFQSADHLISALDCLPIRKPSDRVAKPASEAAVEPADETPTDPGPDLTSDSTEAAEPIPVPNDQTNRPLIAGIVLAVLLTATAIAMAALILCGAHR